MADKHDCGAPNCPGHPPMREQAADLFAEASRVLGDIAVELRSGATDFLSMRKRFNDAADRSNAGGYALVKAFEDEDPETHRSMVMAALYETIMRHYGTGGPN